MLYGSLVGLALGLTGGGGSIVTLPILVYMVGESVHDAIGTSLAIVAGISAQGLLSQRRYLDWRTGLLLGVLGIAGSVPGSILAMRVDGRVLLLLFSGIMIVAAALMLRAKAERADDAKSPSLIVVAVSGVTLGFLTGFLGVGGGFLIVPTLILAFGFSMQRAIPTSLLLIALNSLSSLATRAATSPVQWIVVLEFMAGGLIGSAVGTIGARTLDQRRLKQIFASFVIMIGIFTGGSAMGIIPIRVH